MDGTVNALTTDSPGQAILATVTTTTPNESVSAVSSLLEMGGCFTAVDSTLYDDTGNLVQEGSAEAQCMFGSYIDSAFYPVTLADPGTYSLLLIPEQLVDGINNLQIWAGTNGAGGLGSIAELTPTKSAAFQFTESAPNQSPTLVATAAADFCADEGVGVVTFYLIPPHPDGGEPGFDDMPLLPVDEEDGCASTSPIFLDADFPAAGTYTIIAMLDYAVPGTLGTVNISGTP